MKDMLSKQLTNTSYKQYDTSTKWSFNVIVTQVNSKNKWKIQVAGVLNTSQASVNHKENTEGESKIDNLEKLTACGTRKRKTNNQHTMRWPPRYTKKHK